MSSPGPAIRYVAGGTVQAGEGAYVERRADAELLRLCREGAFAYVLTSRQMGKSSLMIRTAEQLLEEQIKPVIIDLTELGARTTADQWYRGVLEKIAEQLELRTDVAQWWRQQERVSVAQRFNRFLTDVVLDEVEERVVIFVDEIDTTLRIDFTDDFFASIRFLYNARAGNRALSRLSFVLLGVASPGDLMKDPERTPFNIGQRVDLDDFTEQEAAQGLHAEPALIRSVFAFTGGHPYLTLRVLRSLAEEPLESPIESRVAALFFGEQADRDSNLQFVRDMLTIRAPDREAVLLRYRDVWRGRQVPDKEADAVCAWLRLSGVVRRQGGHLRVRNPIYRQVFDERWISRNRTVNWGKRAAWAAAVAAGLLILVAAVLAPVAYMQRNRALAAHRSEAEQRRMAEGSAASERLARAKEEKSRIEAETQRAIAEEQRDRAARAEAEARRYSVEATARGLTAHSLLVRAVNPNLTSVSSLLAVEAFRRMPSAETFQSVADDLPLLRRLASGMHHGGAVEALAFTPNGALLVTASADNTARAFEVHTGREIARHLQQQPVHSVSLSPGANLIATGSEDGEVRVLDTRTGRHLQSMRHPDRVYALAFSPDGTLLVTAAADRTARVLDVGSGRELARIPVLGTVSGIAFSRVGGLVATASEDLRVFEARTGKQTAETKIEERAVTVAFSPDGTNVAAGFERGLRLFAARTGEQVREFAASRISSIEFSPDGELLAVASQDNTATVFETGTAKRLASLTHQGSVNVLAFSADGALVATGSADGSARLFEARSGREVARLTHGSSVRQVALTRDGRLLATGAVDGWARVFEVATDRRIGRLSTVAPPQEISVSRDGAVVGTGRIFGPARADVFDIRNRRHLKTVLEEDDDSIFSVSVSPDGSKAAIGLNGGAARLIDVRTTRDIVRIKNDTPDGSVFGSAFSPDGKLFATGSSDAAARVFDLQTGRQLTRTTHGESVYLVSFSPDGTLVGAELKVRTEIFEARTGRQLRWLPESRSEGPVAFGNGGLLAAVSSTRTVNIFDIRARREVARTGPLGVVKQISFSPDGTTLAVASENLLQLFEARTGRDTGRAEHQGDVAAFAFSQDSRFLATAANDGLVRVLDVRGGRELARLAYPDGPKWVWFTDNGETLSVVAGSTISVTPWKPEQIIDYVCSHVPFNLTLEQWKRYLPGQPYRKTCPNLP